MKKIQTDHHLNFFHYLTRKQRNKIWSLLEGKTTVTLQSKSLLFEEDTSGKKTAGWKTNVASFKKCCSAEVMTVDQKLLILLENWRTDRFFQLLFFLLKNLIFCLPTHYWDFSEEKVTQRKVEKVFELAAFKCWTWIRPENSVHDSYQVIEESWILIGNSRIQVLYEEGLEPRNGPRQCRTLQGSRQNFRNPRFLAIKMFREVERWLMPLGSSFWM